jgi:hypothetical protein
MRLAGELPIVYLQALLENHSWKILTRLKSSWFSGSGCRLLTRINERAAQKVIGDRHEEIE